MEMWPAIGSIERRCDVGLKGRQKVMWVACPTCGLERWVDPRFSERMCTHCRGKIAQKHSLDWRKTHVHRPDCKCSTCKPIDQYREKNPGWGGGKTHVSGYVAILLPPDDPFYEMGDTKNHYVLEHRLVMARHIGRPLTKDETVHHKNGIRTDNRIENLELWIGNHSKGQRVEDILNEYAELFGYRKG